MALQSGGNVGVSGTVEAGRRNSSSLNFGVLDYLVERDRRARREFGAGRRELQKALLSGMVRKKWIAREDVSAGARCGGAW